ncbi:MAG TPA: tetratricopeptide repeat protein [Rhizomicrobium sp.]|nr:tetratricopeptide repeat protein [Rhizomicrobium sp.]
MSDIFHEVEEDVRRERFEKLWKQYGDYAIALAAVIVIAIAGYKFWQRYETQQRLNASAAFFAAQQAAASGNSTAAAASFANIAKTAPGGYSEAANLAEANALFAAGNRNDALALYKKIAQNSSSPLSAVARIRAAWATVDSAPRSDIEELLAPLNTQSNSWRFMAREILAYADYRAGATAQSQSEFAALAADKDAPESLQARARAMAEFMKAGGDKNFGNVPKPPAPPTEADNSKGQPSP